MERFKEGQKVKIIDGCSLYNNHIGTIIGKADKNFGQGYYVEFEWDEKEQLSTTWLFDEKYITEA
jgi:hypothetical protein